MTAPPQLAGPRQSAEERRRSVLEAATAEFAERGYAGTATEAIAERAGISQPYLFRLFGTKRDLFIAAVELVHRRIEDAFRSAAEGRRGAEALMAMGESYKMLLAERDLLLVQLHSFAASSDPEIQAATRDGFRHLWEAASELTGYPAEALRPFFAQGMLLSVMAAIDAVGLAEPWARACQPDAEKFLDSFGPL